MTEYFSNIKDILNGAQFRTVKTNYAQIIEGWKDIIGKKFADKSEVGEFYNRGGKVSMLVYVKSSPLVQELGFFKKNIINKIKEKYGVEIYEIIIKPISSFPKEKPVAKETDVIEFYDERPTENELENIELDAQILQNIKASVSKQSALTDAQKERMLKIIVNDLKTQEWMKQKGFPICQKCGRVMIRKTFGENNICSICKNSELQEE
ncbi:MAG: DUF721 domain-containing protein [bacterium]|nr:DUF721 domain-containing protein [bacterium]